MATSFKEAEARTEEDNRAVSLVSSSSREDCLRQVEYYFCDENLPKDKFLLSRRDSEGAIPCSVIAHSNRIQQYLPALTEAQRALLVYDVASDSDSIRQVPPCSLARIRPLPSEDESLERSVYLKFPRNVEPPPLENSRRLRDLRETRDYTGAVVVEFATAEAAKAFVETGKHPQGATEVRMYNEKNSKVIAFSKARPGLDREMLKERAPAAIFVDYERGDDSGHLRFATPRDASTAIDALLSSPGEEEFVLLDDRQEAEYWRLVNDRARFTVRKRRGGGGRGGGGMGGGRGGRGNKRGRGLNIPQ